MSKKFVLRNSNPLVSVHRVHGLKILPGLAYIDMVYQHFRREGHDFAALEMRKLAIHQPMVLPGSEDILVDLQVLEVRPGVWQVLIDGTRQQDGRAVAEKVRYVVCEMHRSAVAFDAAEDLPAAPPRHQAKASEAIYSAFRERGLAHDGFMQVGGEGYSSPTHAFADISLGHEASADRAKYMFHPALLDGGVTCVAGALLGPESGGEASAPAGLFLPLSYNGFRAVALIREDCTTRVRRESVRQRQDLFVLTVDFLDGSGRKIAELTDLALKQLRTTDAIAESPAASARAPARRESAAASPVEPARPVAATTDTRAFLRDFIAGVIARRLNVPTEKISPDIGYYEMGLDSTGLLELVGLMETRLGLSLPPTLLFEYATITELTDHLIESHADDLARAIAGTSTSEPPARAASPAAPVSVAPASVAAATAATRPADPVAPREHDIAIIGMAGRFPQARNLGELWRNLKEGRDCVVDIPPDRWDWREVDGLMGSTIGVSHWGGFIADADCFDARFFRITPRDAENIDPQERLFLEVSWEAIEDAGYTPKTLTTPRGASKRRDVGVFAGVMHRDYVVLQSQRLGAGHVQPVVLSAAAIANRVSYVFNLHGPSVVVDTQCSSSLTAVHMAAESLRHGECEVALAGGVNLSLHPAKYITYALLGLHSSDGRCRTFGEGGDGYVTAEGIGTVVLKPLARAVADDDHIYAVIKASAANHGGTTSGLSVPSSVAQADLIVRCMAGANIDPASVSYVEAHGTGTALGDPIEIEGLSKVFRGREAGNPVVIGSIKSNIGHAESAAGVSGLIKLALQLRHATLVPSLHGDRPNPHIDWSRLPFVVQRRLEPWPQPRLTVDGQTRAIPRRGALSSFGAVGANVHLVVDEYPAPHAAPGAWSRDPAVVPLSAQTPEQLAAYVRRLLDRLLDAEAETLDDVHRIARTLQVGREAYAARAAFVARDTGDLRRLLESYLRGDAARGEWFAGEAGKSDDRAAPDEDAQAFARQCLAESRLDALAERWVQGANVHWHALYEAGAPRRLSLPTYPFAKERYWLEASGEAASPRRAERARLLHPLLHENTSNLEEQRFSSRFDGEEFYLRDHVVVDARVLPGVAYLEMAHAALLHASTGPQQRFRLRNVVWAQPVVVAAQPVTLHVALLRGPTGDLACEIYTDSNDNGERTIHFQCGATPLTQDDARIDLAALRARRDGEIPVDDCYALLGMGGLNYGTAFRSMQHIGTGKAADGAPFVLTHLDLPEPIRAGAQDFHLHPSLLDGALQSSIGLSLMSSTGDGTVDSRPHLPYAVETFDVFAPVHGEVHAFVRLASGSSERLRKFDLALCDAAGNVCVDIRGFSVRLLDRPAGAPAPAVAAAPAPNAPNAPLTFAEEWLPQPLVASEAGTGAVICVLADEANRDLLQAVAASAAPSRQSVFVAPAAAAGTDGPDAASYALALASAAEQCGAPDAVVALWPVERPASIPDYRELLAFVQGLAAANLPKVRVVLAAVCRTPLERAYVDSWIAVTSSLKRLLPHHLQIVGIVADDALRGDPSLALRETFLRTLAELDDAQGACAFFDGGVRHVRRMVPTARTAGGPVLREGATYLVTGGLGAIGQHVAERLVRGHRANLLLLGRSPRDAATQARIESWQEQGSRVRHLRVDVADAEALRTALDAHIAEYGPIAGVFHVAGISAERSVFEATNADFERVLAPKVAGTLALEYALAGRTLDFFCYFSSSSAVLGDFGPCAYALANRFQMAYARHAEALPSGRRIAINWPLWKDGAFGIGDEAATDFYLQSSGQRVLQTTEALDLLERVLAEAPPQQLVLTGEAAPLQRLLANAGVSVVEPVVEPTAAPAAAPAPDAVDANDPLVPRMLRFLRGVLGASVKLPIERVSAETRLDEYGFDSMLAMTMTNELEASFGSLSKTLFFEHRDLASLGRYLLQAHRPAAMKLFGVEAPAVAAASAPAAPRLAAAPLRQARALSVAAPVAAPRAAVDDVAIVAFSGRFPQANDLDAFWQLLRSGGDAVSEVPRHRWNCDTHFDAVKGTYGRNYCRWGGFLDNVEDFDPLFFNITPVEAQFTDPQQRLFLETVWNLLEGAGYTRDALQDDYAGNVGVYVGSMYSEYGSLSNDPTAGTTPQGGIANRVSYFFGLQGPSLAVDTMCSSAFVAIHMACADLRQGLCALAIAGGVNLSMHPKKYIALSQTQMLASGARGRSFGDTDGYLPAECVGAVLLKPLSRAVADGDAILGVVKGSALNHGGRGNGYSVPNPDAQVQVMQAALRSAQCTPQSIGYVEAAANGSPLGDAIEMTALQKVFADVPRQACAIGAVKSNIGHAEAASGMAQLAKVLLQLRHGELAPTIQADPPNPRFAFDATPFRLQTTLGAWPQSAPRRALINSFGAGGSNASLVIEAYAAPAVPEPAPTAFDARHVVIASAKNAERLHELVRSLADHVAAHPSLPLADIAYTLQCGREAMASRIALVASTRDELLGGWEAYLTGKPNARSAHAVTFVAGPAESAAMSSFTGGSAGQALLDTFVREHDHEKLAMFWTNGGKVPWASVRGTRRRIVPLPGYPFARQRYWLEAEEPVAPPVTFRSVAPRAVAVLDADGRRAVPLVHPLLHVNSSDLGECRFSSTFTGDEPYASRDRVRDVRLIPEAVYFEMLRAAVERMTGRPDWTRDTEAIRYTGLEWHGPVEIAAGPVTVHVALRALDADRIACEIYSLPVRDEAATGEPERTVHCRATAVLGARPAALPAADLPALRAACASIVSTDDWYGALAGIGMEYGDAYRQAGAIRSGIADGGAGYAVADLALHAADDGEPALGLPPTLVNVALQAALVQLTSIGSPGDGKALPTSLACDEFVVLAPLASSVAIHVHRAQSGTARAAVDVDIYDDTGILLARIAGLSAAGEAGGDAAPEAPAPAPAVARDAVAPRNELESTLLAVWEEALGFAGFGVFDSFLDLGGNSLRAALVVARVNEHYQVAIDVPALLMPDCSIARLSGLVVAELARQVGTESMS